MPPLLSRLRLFLSIGSLLLIAPGCHSAPMQPEQAGHPAALKQAEPPVAVAPIIQALLDTATAGSPRAANTRLGLQAGADVRAFYGPAAAPAWTSSAGGLNADATAALALLARAADYGLRPADYGGTRLPALRDSLARPTLPAQRARQLALLEVYLSDAVLTFMRDLGRGRLHPYTPSAREKAAGPAGRTTILLRTALASHAVPAAMLAGQPTNREYRELQHALAAWLARPVAADSAPDSVARHQTQFEQAAVNLERWRWEAMPAEPEYLLINIPAFELQAVANDSVLRRYRVIVGKPGTTTPTLSSTIRHFTLAPDWHVPRSIATKEMLRLIKKDAGYFGRNNLTLYNTKGQLVDPLRVNWAAVTVTNFAYTIRQSAGCENSLGNIVFRFANPYSVYLHDTPARPLLASPVRALSHGCIRLEQPMALAAYLLRRGGQPVQLPSEEECANQPRPHDVRLARAMPIYIRYATCTAENGQLRFLPDIYQRDETLRRALFGPTP